MSEVRAQFPEKLGFLFEPARYKILHGGRGGTKSWGIARALLIMGAERKMLVVCARETMQSIKDSVHRLLASQIERLGLHAHYTIEKATIRGSNGTEFIFAGLLHNVDQIKSLEGADVVWVEEAQRVSKESWDKLVPTVRAPGSEIWVSFNPELDTDETWRRFCITPPTGAKVVQVGWRDNPWFPEVLELERLDMQRMDPAGYRNVWEGETRSSVEGAIFAAEIQLAEDEGRIAKFPVDRTKPINTYWDLGFGDKNAIWFEQAVGGWHRLVDYLEDSGRTIDWYIIQMQQKGYLYGTHWLPWDGVDAMTHHRLVGGDRSKSVEMIMREAGLSVRLAPKLAITSRINAGRQMFSQVQIDKDKCQMGIQRLRRYQWGKPSTKVARVDPLTGKLSTGSEPLHDENSHGADGFQTMAVCAKQPKNTPPVQQRQEEEYSAYGLWWLIAMLPGGALYYALNAAFRYIEHFC